MGLETLGPKRNLSRQDPKAQKYPYLLRGLAIHHPNEVWETDITYVPMAKGYMYLIAVIDVYSRFVLNWSVSNTMDAGWVRETLQEAIRFHGKPQIINSDQGSQFTSKEYTSLLKDEKILISMDGKGRALDNIFIERLWRSVKYEYVYLNPATDGLELYQGLKKWFYFYNHERHHQHLKYRKPHEVYRLAA
ncbi:MAG: IS3 family transposase [Chitinophagaceae bacterium]